MSDSNHATMIALTILAGSTCGLIMMSIWLIGFVRDLRRELKAIRADLSVSKTLVDRQEGRDEIRAMKIVDSESSIVHTDAMRP